MVKDSVETAWYDFVDQNNAVIHRGNKILDKLSITNEIDTVPTMSLTIPLSEMPTSENWNTIQVKVFLGEKYVFWGLIDSFEIDYAAYSVTLDLSHIVAEHRNHFMPVNLIVKNMPFKNLYNHMDFNVPGWVYEFSEKAASTRIEYTFSSESKLAAMQEAIEQTEDIHWRVPLTEERVVQFGEFGDIVDVVMSQARNFPDECADLSKYPTMLTEPKLSMDFTDHVNRIVVLCGDIDKDVEHLTLKYIYEHPELQTAGFPVGMYENNINQQPETEWEEDLTSGNNAVSGDTQTTKTGIRK